MIIKKIKWIAIVSIIGAIALLYGADKLNIKDENKDIGVSMLKNEWEIFDVDTIAGETPSVLFGGLKESSAILKYRLELRYPFDGKVGFYGGSDRDQIMEDTNNEPLANGLKNETAYLFRTIDDGETFTRQKLGHGIAQEIKEIGGSYFLRIHEADTWKDRTFRSDDNGKSWKYVGDFYIDAMFDKDRFIYVVVKSISRSERSHSYFYTKDGGKTSKPLPEKILSYHTSEKLNTHLFYKGKLVFLKKNSLFFVDIDTLEEEVYPFDIPNGKVIRDIKVDKRSGELYIVLLNKDKSKPMRFSIYYPFKDVLVEFDKSSKDLDKVPVFLKVDGNYIGSLTRINGVLFHFWTLNYGKKWEMEVLENFFYDDAFTGYGNGRIYMNALVKTKEKKDRKPYFIMGHIK
jgi:hypothetical protein